MASRKNNEIVLTKEQELKILQLWQLSENPPTISGLGEAVFGEEVKGTDKKGRAIKTFLASKSLKAKSRHDYIPPKVITLTPEQKEYILNNASQMKAFEMAEVLFEKKNLSNLSLETRAVIAELKTLNAICFDDLTDADIGNYDPPKTRPACIRKINKYVSRRLDSDNLSPKQVKDIDSLITFLRNPRFLSQINTYTKQQERNLFESSFIRYTHDKFELTEEEVDQYIVLSMEVINGHSVQMQIEYLRKLRDSVAEDTDGKISMSIVEAVSKSQKEYNDCVARQQRLFKSLTQERREKIEKRLDASSSLLNFVELMKKEDTRKEMLEVAKKRELVVREEIERIRSLEDLKIRIIGATEDSSIYGS